MARTMMFEELRVLLSHVNNADILRSDYVRAIEKENCLGKRSGKTRSLTVRHLTDLYSLDPSVAVFRCLLYFWNRDPAARPLLALLCAYARDPIFRVSAPYILNLAAGSKLQREKLEWLFEEQFAGRFTTSTLKSTVRNISSTWTKSGHLSGKVTKLRTKVRATTGTVSYALLLGYLTGLRGETLFSSEYMKLLDVTMDGALDLAAQASQRGWLKFKRISNIVEVLFPNMLTDQELEWTREQN